MSWDREKTVLSIVGSVVTLGLGYLIWRHENKIAAANNAATVSANAEIAQQQTQQIQDEIDALPSGISAASYASPTDYGTSGTTSSSPTAEDSNITAILDAFFGNQNSTASSTSTSSTTSTTGTGNNNIVIGGGDTGTTTVTPVTSTFTSGSQPPSQLPTGSQTVTATTQPIKSVLPATYPMTSTA